MIAHACDECARRILFFSDNICSGHYLESVMASAVRNCACVRIVLLHARFSVVGPIPSIGRHFFVGSSLYRKYKCTTVLPD